MKRLVDHRCAIEQWANDARRSRRNVKECGKELERLVKPNLMVTISLRRRMELEEALRRVRAALRELEKELGTHLRGMIVWDHGKADHRLHFHLLIGGVRYLDREELWEKWFKKFGRTRIEPYIYGMGGAHYVAKNGFSEEGGFEPWRSMDA